MTEQGWVLGRLLESARRCEHDALVTCNLTLRWPEFASSIDGGVNDLSSVRNRRVALLFSRTPAALSALLRLNGSDVTWSCSPSTVPVEQARALVAALHLGAVVRAAGGDEDRLSIEQGTDEAKATGRATVTILTSGTTGEPKAVRHTWHSLAKAARDAPPQRWFLTYRPDLYTGLQVILQCWLNAGSLIVPSSRMSDQICSPDGGRRGRVRVSDSLVLEMADVAWQASRTPPHRVLSDSRPRSEAEVVDQATPERLRQQFPGARRSSRIYATSEVGRCFSVTDCRAGFPAKFLDVRSDDGIEMKIVDGELFIRSANGMEAYETGTGPTPEWLPTGDLVQRIGDRVHFTGRRTDLINVGGNKVHPSEVESVVSAVPGVVDARVFGTRSSIAGQLVACEVSLAATANAEGTVDAIRKACATRLAPYQRPFAITVVPEITLTAAGKKRRT